MSVTHICEHCFQEHTPCCPECPCRKASLPDGPEGKPLHEQHDPVEAGAVALWKLGNERIGYRPWESVAEHYRREARAVLEAVGRPAPASGAEPLTAEDVREAYNNRYSLGQGDGMWANVASALNARLSRSPAPAGPTAPLCLHCETRHESLECPSPTASLPPSPGGEG